MFKMGKSKKRGSANDDEDDDGKDIVVDQSSTNGMTFDDLTMIKDRGRYGGSASFDSTPIIPTVGSAPLDLNSAQPANMSNVQYRKQMTALKKQVLTQAGTLGDIGDPRAISLQGGNPYLNGDHPRTGSLVNQRPPPPPFANGSRANSLTNQPPQQGSYGPRAYSMTNNPTAFANGPRANSLTNRPPPPQNFQHQRQQLPPSSRAYSLTTGNPYQQGRPPPQQRPVGPPNGRSPYGPPPSGTNRGPGYRNRPPPAQHRNSIPGVPSPLSQSQSNLPVLVQTQAQDSQQQVHPATQNHPPIENEEYQIAEQSSFKETLGQNDYNHHYLAINQRNDDSLAFNSSDNSIYKDQSTAILPNGESTPSPSHHQHDQSSLANETSPSKLPRSKGLPHLSLLSLGDNSDDSDDEINKNTSLTDLSQPSPQHQQKPVLPNSFQSSSSSSSSREFIPRSLDPLDEFKPYETNQQRTVTPPLNPDPTLRNDGNIRSSPIRSNRYQEFSTHSSTAAPRFISPVKNDRSNNVADNRHSKNQVSISSTSQYSTVSANPEVDNDYNRKIYGLAANSTTNQDEFVTASQFSMLGSKTNVDRKDVDDTADYNHFNDQSTMGQSTIQEHSTHSEPRTDSYYDVETPKLNGTTRQRFSDDHGHEHGNDVVDLDQTPVIDQRFSKSVNTTPLNVKRLSTESVASSSKGKKSTFKSPGFFRKWSKKKDDKKKASGEVFEPVVKPINSSVIESNGTFESRNVSNYSEKESERRRRSSQPERKFDGYGVSDSGSSVLIHGAPDAGFNETDRDFQPGEPRQMSPSVSKYQPLCSVAEGRAVGGLQTLGESFVPEKKLAQPVDESKSKSLHFTVDQLGIMEEKTDLIQELDLVSKELANSIKREIQLEEELKKSPKAASYSPILTEESHYERLRESAQQIADLTRKLNEERKIRYIAEEHVLLRENNQVPSALKLNYEIDQLKSEIASRDELINQLQSEVEEFKKEVPILRENYQKVKEINDNNESVVIPNLQNKIEVLTNDRKKLSIINEKYNILKNEKVELENKLNDQSKNDFTFLAYNNTSETEFPASSGNLSYKSTTESKSPNRSSLHVQRPYLTGTTTFDERHESLLKNKKLTSFSLVNVTPTSSEN
jgi:hypothetical protein